MPIDFACPACQRKLRVADGSAGKKVRCPSCGAVAPIPSGAVAPIPSGSPAGAGFGSADLSEQVPRAASAGPSIGGESNPFASFPQISTAPANPYAAPQIDLRPSAASAADVWRPAAVDASEIISRAFQIWQRHLGILVGVMLIVPAITWGLSFAFVFVLGVVEDVAGETAVIVAYLGSQLLVNGLGILLGIGSTQISLKLARGQRAEIADLFRGGRRLLPVIGVTILYTLVVIAGMLLLLVPALAMVALFWPVRLLVVDEKAHVLESFGKAYQFTKLNFGTTIVLALASFGISLLGMLALCIGVIFAVPLVSMLWIVGYLMMTGQISQRSDVYGAGAATSLSAGQ